MRARSLGSRVRPVCSRGLTAASRWAVFPAGDDGGEQVEPSHAVVLAFAGAVLDFALASDPEVVLEDVMSLALVQAGVGAAVSVRGASSGRPSLSPRPLPNRPRQASHTYTRPMTETRIGATRIGYARCSTDRLDLAAQRQALLELGGAEDRIYTDHGITGAIRARPGLDQALAACARATPWSCPNSTAWPGPSRTPAPSPTSFSNAA